jgi:hypothetical protein
MLQAGSETSSTLDTSHLASWTNEASRTFTPPTLKGSRNATSSPAWASGALHYVGRDGRTLDLFGPALVPANLSARQAKAQGLLTSGTSGRTSTGSLSSAALQSSLESRLRARTQTLGSTLYALTWKPWVTPSGRSRSRLRGSALRTSETGFTGWPTPTTRDWKDGAQCDNVPLNALLGRVVWLVQRPELRKGWSERDSGVDATGWHVRMGSGDRLNPAHSRWLMGLPPEWDACAPTATRSTQSRRKSGSKQ